jgi:outer membrane protein
MSKKIALATLAALSLAGAAHAQAVQEPWLVRVRAVHIDPANKDSTGLDLAINNKTIPELDISYFFTPNWAAELVLTYPQKHELSAGGSKIGTLKHLPPTLSLQYHFAPEASFRPYVGLGMNYTNFSDVHFVPAVQAALSPSIKNSSWGLAAQVGADYQLSKNLFLNVDLKKVQIRTKVYAAGTEVGKFKVDPLLVGVGLGWRF